MSFMSAPHSLPAPLDFDQALFTISDCLTEARSARDQGEDRRARALYAAAERYATRTGFVELIRLVWAYDESLPVVSMPSGTSDPFVSLDPVFGTSHTAAPPD